MIKRVHLCQISFIRSTLGQNVKAYAKKPYAYNISNMLMKTKGYIYICVCVCVFGCVCLGVCVSNVNVDPQPLKSI